MMHLVAVYQCIELFVTDPVFLTGVQQVFAAYPLFFEDQLFYRCHTVGNSSYSYRLRAGEVVNGAASCHVDTTFRTIINQCGKVGKGFHTLVNDIHDLNSCNHLVSPVFHLFVVGFQHLVKGSEICNAPSFRPQTFANAAALIPTHTVGRTADTSTIIYCKFIDFCNAEIRRVVPPVFLATCIYLDASDYMIISSIFSCSSNTQSCWYGRLIIK